MPLLSLLEAAEILGTRPRHVRVLTRERGLPFVKVGRLTRIDSDDLDAWIAANRHGDRP
jgi:excisionase family DNA binding protein